MPFWEYNVQTTPCRTHSSELKHLWKAGKMPGHLFWTLSCMLANESSNWSTVSLCHTLGNMSVQIQRCPLAASIHRVASALLSSPLFPVVDGQKCNAIQWDTCWFRLERDFQYSAFYMRVGIFIDQCVGESLFIAWEWTLKVCWHEGPPQCVRFYCCCDPWINVFPS